MKYFFTTLCLVVTATLSLSAQNVYKIQNSLDTVLYLGSKTHEGNFHADKNAYRVLQNNKVRYISTDSLVGVNLLSPQQLLSEIKRKELAFVFEDVQPAWTLILTDKHLHFIQYDGSETKLPIKYNFNGSFHHPCVSFQSKNCEVYGVVDFNANCLYEIDDRVEYAFYKVLFSIQGKVFSACGCLDKKGY